MGLAVNLRRLGRPGRLTFVSTTRRQSRLAPAAPGAAPRQRRRPVGRWLARTGSLSAAIIAAGSVIAVSFDNGGFSVASRSSVGIAVWWALSLGVAVGVWNLRDLPRAATVTAGLLVVFAVISAASMAWASSGERAYEEFTRVLLYIGIFLLAALAVRRSAVVRTTDGLAWGLAVVVIAALASRVFPELVDTRSAFRLLPFGLARLNYPIGYWNGLGVMIALGFPLLLRIAIDHPRRALRLAAAVTIPIFGTSLYLTSSRTGVAATLVAMFIVLWLVRDRWAVTVTLAIVGLGTAAGVEVVLARPLLANGPLGTHAETSQAHSAALWIAVVCVATGCAHGLVSRRAADLLARALPQRLPAIAATLLLVAAVAFVHPVQRFDSFRQAVPLVVSSDYVREHLLSSNGNGRWQMWTAALHQFEAHPLRGAGAGAFESWWEAHRPMALFVRNAHSVYLEVLGELGIIGLAALLAMFAAVVITAGRRLASLPVERRSAAAALTATFAAFLVAAGLDWMWQLTAVAGVAMAAAGLLTGVATAPERDSEQVTDWAGSVRIGFVAACVCLLVIVLQAIPFLANLEVANSEAAARRGDLTVATTRALSARSVEPWAASPYVQLALVAERQGDYPLALRRIRQAIARDDADWLLWLTRARIETESGDVVAARRSLVSMKRLNPLGYKQLATQGGG